MTEKAFDKGAYVDKDRNGFDDRDKNHDGKVSFTEKLSDKPIQDRNRDGWDDRDRNKDGHVSMGEKMLGAKSIQDRNGDGFDDRDRNMDGHVSMGEKMLGAKGTTAGAQEYCTDMRCHSFSPCSRHPQMGTHHHHGGDLGLAGATQKLTLAEEQQIVGKQQRSAGEVEVHKRVETQHVREQIPVRREEVVIERRPIHGSAQPGELPLTSHDATITVPLYKEEVVAQKVVVPKEEIVLRKREVVEHQTVEADLKSEFAETHRTSATATHGTHGIQDTHGAIATGTHGAIGTGTHGTMDTGLHGTGAHGALGTNAGFGDKRDLNGDGKVTTGEKAKSALGMGHKDAAFDKRDLNHDGHVSSTEKVAAASATSHGPSLGAHDARDTNHDGHVSMKEKIKDKLHLGRHKEAHLTNE
jgi:uncharacterized protein (TIGR02271 family)